MRLISILFKKHNKVPLASTCRGAWLVKVLQDASKFPFSCLERDALVESCKRAPTENDLRDILFEAIVGNDAMSEASKETLADLVAAESWDEVATELGVVVVVAASLENFTKKTMPKVEKSAPLMDLKMTIIGIFQESKKILQSPEQCTSFRMKLLNCNSESVLVETIMECILNIECIDDSSRTRIATDLLENRFYRLLYADRFDCDESDCMICFETYAKSSPKKLACGHELCEDCFGKLKCTNCPVCRREF